MPTPATNPLEPKPGIVSSAMFSNGAPAPESATFGYTAERVTLDPETDTVEGRIQKIIEKNNPLMQRASAQGFRLSNDRGLINSSMAIGAAEDAVYNAAMPIAQTDATNALSVKQWNQTAGNQAAQFGAGEMNTSYRLDTTGRQRIREIGAQGDVQARLQANQQKLDMERDLHLAGIQSQRDAVLQQYDLDKGRINQQYTLDLEAAKHLQGMDRLNAEEAAKSRLQADLAAIEEGKTARLAAHDAELARIASERDQGEAMQLEAVRIEAEKQLEALRSANQSQISGGGQVAHVLGAAQAAIAAVMADPNIPANNKQGLINSILDQAYTQAGAVAAINGIDLSEILVFEPTGGRGRGYRPGDQWGGPIPGSLPEDMDRDQDGIRNRDDEPRTRGGG